MEFREFAFDEHGDIDLERIERKYEAALRGRGRVYEEVGRAVGFDVDSSNLPQALKLLYEKGVDDAMELMGDDLVKYVKGGGDLKVLVLFEKNGWVDCGDIIRRQVRIRFWRLLIHFIVFAVIVAIYFLLW